MLWIDHKQKSKNLEEKTLFLLEKINLQHNEGYNVVFE